MLFEATGVILYPVFQMRNAPRDHSAKGEDRLFLGMDLLLRCFWLGFGMAVCLVRCFQSLRHRCPVGKGNIGIKDELIETIETPWIFRVYGPNVKVRWTDSSAHFCAPVAIDVVQEHFSRCEMLL